LLDKNDLFLAYHPETGKRIWQFMYPADGMLDYGKAPRATPAIVNGRVITLGAYGHLHCLDAKLGRVLWNKDFVKELRAELPTWGFCGSPLIVENKVIVQTGAPEASLIAYDLNDGKEIWRSAGDRVSYSSFVTTRIGDRHQCLGYDEKAIGGWDLVTGEKLWTLQPPEIGDFNVGTPLVKDDRFWVATENNHLRAYEFDEKGNANANPVAMDSNFSPDSHTPVIVGDRLVGVFDGLRCLHAKDLKPVWIHEDPAYSAYASIIACENRVLVLSEDCQLVLVDVSGNEYRELGRLSLTDSDTPTQSYPALIGHDIIVRIDKELICIGLD
jgi:outer membrane protein assembly factor BamB